MASESERLAALAETARNEGNEDRVLPQLAAYLGDNPGDIVVLHWHALLLRGLDRRGEAIELLDAARRLAPHDASLAHSLARVTLEAGRPATGLFHDAIRIAPSRPELRLGLAAARFAEGDGAAALDDLGTMLTGNAGWYAGHRQYAQLAAMVGQRETAMASYERAIATFPESGQLYFEAAGLLIEGERYAEALALLDRAPAQVGEDQALLCIKAGALDELGRTLEAEALFARLGFVDSLSHAVRRQRHLLRRGETGVAIAELEPWITAGVMTGLWPYAALAWRLGNDPRAQWLEREDLITTVDLGADEADLQALATLLRRLHAGGGRYFDQSVRNGTQTDGALLGRCEPEIVRLRASLARRVGEHIASLPDPEAGHPALAPRRDRPVRFAGSWSVRLSEAGFHAGHHHPQGWFSSAFYVTVPEGLEAEEGMLALGESPADLGLGLPAYRTIAPKPGRLVLFPSTMWHATRPFRAGERITVAFDVAPS